MKRSLTILVLLFISHFLNAQEKPGTPNELDKLFIPDKNSLFNSESKTNEENSLPASDIKNVIKFNVAMLPRSIAAFYYQRRLTDQISLQGGLGICFNKDRIFSVVSGFSGDFSSSTAIDLEDMMANGQFSRNSLFTSFSFRLNWVSYFEWNASPYFEINTRYYSNKLKLDKFVDDRHGFSETPETIVRNTSFNLIYGLQYITEGKIKTSHDFYWGIGMRNTSFDTFTSSEITTSGPNYILYTKDPERSKRLAPSFIMGYAFGIGFK